MKHTLIFITTLFIGTSLYAQSVNDYKYVVVSEKFDFTQSNDQYQVNSLTKFLFNKYGFEAYMKGELMPFSINEQGCEALYADVLSDSGFISTKLQVVLKDCNDKVVFKTSFASSKDKDYKRAYHEALRGAFFDIEALEYRFSGKPVSNDDPVNKMVSLEKGDLTVVKNPISIKKNVNPKLSDLTDTKDTNLIDSQVTFMSEDGFYKAIKQDMLLTFKEGSKVIGVTMINMEDSFPVTTSEFIGNAYFLEGRLIIERKIKGIVEPVEMIFTKE